MMNYESLASEYHEQNPEPEEPAGLWDNLAKAQEMLPEYFLEMEREMVISELMEVDGIETDES